MSLTTSPEFLLLSTNRAALSINRGALAFSNNSWDCFSISSNVLREALTDMAKRAIGERTWSVRCVVASLRGLCRH